MIHNWLVELDRITFSKSENDSGSHTPKRIKTHAMSAHILIARGSAACAKKLKLKRSRWEPERSCWSAALCVLFTSATWKWFIQHRTAAFAEQHNIMFTRCTCAPREREHQSKRAEMWVSEREREKAPWWENQVTCWILQVLFAPTLVQPPWCPRPFSCSAIAL